MPAFWLTYVPKEESAKRGWPLSDLRALIDHVEADPNADGSIEPWRIADSSAQPGDRVYIFKQNSRSNRGIIGVGEIFMGVARKVSANLRQKLPLIARRAVHHCASLQLRGSCPATASCFP